MFCLTLKLLKYNENIVFGFSLSRSLSLFLRFNHCARVININHVTSFVQMHKSRQSFVLLWLCFVVMTL